MLQASRSCITRYWSTPHRTAANLCPRSQHARRKYATVTDLSRYPKPGETLHGFTMLRGKRVPELELTALHLQHERTGAEYLHVARDDKNNVFSIGFKTNPPDDTGVPHILEHTTLCGSEKYPIRDPFFKMLPRSLSNFMNAFTSSDHTTYPFATTNPQDYKNLMSVYLDATLHPLLNIDDFTQEGWRVGPENPLATIPGSPVDGPGRNLVFKGVVYNEMKGQMSDASYLYYIRFQDHIFPSINNSGGDPQKMTDLTYEQLKQFHRKHYHPSNAKLFTYGDMPLADHLQEIGGRLDKFGKIPRDSEVRRPASLEDGPKQITIKGPVDPLMDKDMQHKTSISWLMGDTSNILEGFGLGVVSSLLLDGYGSPLYRALIESGLGSDWSPNTGYDGSGGTGVFSVGLTGVRAENIPNVNEAIYETLKRVSHEGFDNQKVTGILHQLELSLKHKTAHFGMGLMQRLKPGWFNGVDPFDALAWDETISAFKELAADRYLEQLVEKYLLNEKTLTFTMEPSDRHGKDLVSEEASRLANKIAEVTEKAGGEALAREKLEKRELDLLEVQEKARNQDLSCLPSVHVNDIPRQKDRKVIRQGSVGETPVQWRAAPTNGLTYFRAVNEFINLPDELRLYIPLFTDAIMRLGTRDKTTEQLEDLIKLKTGGIRIGYHASTSPASLGSYSEGLAFSGYALDSNVPAMYELLRTLVLETNFDSPDAEGQIRQLLQSEASNAVSSIAESGHGYARRYAEAGLSPQGRLIEEISGLTQVRLTTGLAARDPAAGLEDVIEKLKSIQRFAISGGNSMRAALTCGPESISTNEKSLQGFLQSLPTKSAPAEDTRHVDLPENKIFFPLPYQVYYSALALPTVPYTHEHGAPLQILSQLLTHKHLHHEIREKGGAYGGGAYARALGGIFGFYSYRDPNPLNTVKTMQEAGRWAFEKEFSERDIEEAKLSVFQSLDAPESVSEEGMNRFLNDVDEDMEQTRRERLLDVTRTDVRDVAQKYLLNDASKARMVILGTKKDWVNEQDGWKIEDIGMSQGQPEEAEEIGEGAQVSG